MAFDPETADEPYVRPDERALGCRAVGKLLVVFSTVAADDDRYSVFDPRDLADAEVALLVNPLDRTVEVKKAREPFEVTVQSYHAP